MFEDTRVTISLTNRTQDQPCCTMRGRYATVVIIEEKLFALCRGCSDIRELNEDEMMRVSTLERPGQVAREQLKRHQACNKPAPAPVPAVPQESAGKKRRATR